MLSSQALKDEIKRKSINVDGKNDNIQNNFIEVTLGDSIKVYDAPFLNVTEDTPTREIIIPQEGLMLKPNELYLGRTLEYTKTKKYVPMIEGRSSIGRLGIFIHITAGFGDVGFAGYWTLEIFCIKPIIIYPNVEIAQLYYHTIDGEYEEYTSSKYQNNTDVQPSMLYKDFK